MKLIGRMMLVAAAVAFLGACASTGDPEKVYPVSELKQDFAQFREIIENHTAGLYTDGAELNNLLEKAEEGIRPGMTELEFYRILAPAVAGLRCGHSFLSVSKAMEEEMRTRATLFPLDVRILGGKLYVIADPHSVGVPPGSEILRINGRPSNELIDQILVNMPTDGRDTGRPRYDAERWFASMYYTYIDTPDEYILEIQIPESAASSRVIIPAVKDPTRAKTSKGVVHDTVDTPWSTAFKEGYAYLKIPVFLYRDQKEYNAALERFFSELTSRGTELLILDLRGNYGGTPSPTVELFRYLINEPLPFFAEENPFYLAKWKRPVQPSTNAFDGRLYILMDEACFSMNSFLISLLKYHGIGTLVGAPSSGSFMCSDAARSKVLKNTGIRLRYSTQVFATAVEEQQSGIGIEPDILVDWKLDDYLEGNDPVLAAALEDSGVE